MDSHTICPTIVYWCIGITAFYFKLKVEKLVLRHLHLIWNTT